jgi:8-oxo-dGTP pyrophosphatase MutT (NUDIX family)
MAQPQSPRSCDRRFQPGPPQSGPLFGNAVAQPLPHLRRYNRYQDVEIDASLLPHDELGRFLASLHDEESKWIRRLTNGSGDAKIRSGALFWLRVPVRLCHLIPSLVGTGVFSVHHATPEYFMFVKGPGELPPRSPPLYGTHYARVECVVVEHGTGRILVVLERIGTMDACRKLVTGSVDLGEYISAAAVREVTEETGIRSEFRGVLGLINRIGTRFGRDELLIGCLLTAASGQDPRATSDEIKAVEWSDPALLLSPGSIFMGKRWMAAASRMAVSGIDGGLEGSFHDDFRGHGHRMMMFACF